MFKFLDPTGCTYYGSRAFQYNLPQRGQKVADLTEHPSPGEVDGEPCGSGGLHVMLHLDAQYAPHDWYPWWVSEIRGELGRDAQKVRVVALRLRRIAPKVLHRALRPPFNWGREATLSRADLGWADLCGANLYEAYLSGANLYEAYLSAAQVGRTIHNNATTWPLHFEPESRRKPVRCPVCRKDVRTKVEHRQGGVSASA